MRTVTYNLIQFLFEARRGSFVVPRFQRPFVWNHAQVKLLVDSISRNYPIGSLLLLQETMPKDPFLSARPIEAVIGSAVDPSEDIDGDASAFPPSFYYVLDGQQRLTSLVRVFLQAAKDSIYYFDLDRMLEADSIDKNASSWVVRRDVGRRPLARYIRSDILEDDERCMVLVQEYFESNYDPLKGDRSAQRKAVAKVSRIFETMRNYQIPLVIVDRRDSTEAICRIFETINSTGTRLTTFDLAVARFFPKPDLHDLWQQSKQKYENLERFGIEGERVLQIVAIVSGYEQKSYVEPTRSTLLNLTKEEIIDKWDDCARALSQALDWIEGVGAVPGIISNDALLVPLSYFFLKLTPAWRGINPGYNSVLQRWYYANALQKGARQASNYKIGQSVAILHKWVFDGVAPEVPKIRLNDKELLRLGKTDARYQAILAIIRWKGGEDLWTGEALDPNDVEDHHIFPAAMAKREGISRRLLDSISNRILISRSTNRTLGDRAPIDYLKKLVCEAADSGLLESKIDIMKNSCIPVSINLEDFYKLLDPRFVDVFLALRAKMIMDRLVMVLGDCLDRSDESLYVDIDDDDD